MNSDIDKRTCPECKGTMRQVRLLDRTIEKEVDVEYTVPEAKRSFWTGLYPVEGKVVAFMCDTCGRMSLYGEGTT